MHHKRAILVFLLYWLGIVSINAQSIRIQQGCILEKDKNVRLSNVLVSDKNNHHVAHSDIHGLFNIRAAVGDTIQFSGDDFATTNITVGDFTDVFVYLIPAVQLSEVTIKDHAEVQNLKETLAGYRALGVLYLRNPRYYYIFCKPMSFIYENFKTEMIQARRFKRYSARELNSFRVSERYNQSVIRSEVPSINDADLADFMVRYMPTVTQVYSWNDYELIRYIQDSYSDYVAHKGVIKSETALKTL